MLRADVGGALKMMNVCCPRVRQDVGQQGGGAGRRRLDVCPCRAQFGMALQSVERMLLEQQAQGCTGRDRVPELRQAGQTFGEHLGQNREQRGGCQKQQDSH